MGETRARFYCPLHDQEQHQKSGVVRQDAQGKYRFSCTHLPPHESAIVAALGLNLNGQGPATQEEAPEGGFPGASHVREGDTRQIHPQDNAPSEYQQAQELKHWQQQLFSLAHQVLLRDEEYQKKHVPAEHILEPLTEDLVAAGVDVLVGRGTPIPVGLSKGDIHEECEKAARQAIELWANRLIWSAPVLKNGHEPTVIVERASAIMLEDASQAIISNAEYLSRPAIIDRLYYTHHISLGVGGKHEGKTTAVRTEALAIALGRQMYGRDVIQTPVIYAASDDEYPSTRMELLRMGWSPSVPLWLVRIAEGADPEFVLEDIAKLARAHDAKFVILDMLFDFARITDELKYAHTREATGKIQQLADAIDGHVRSTHHSPKWMTDAGTAAKAALGSQGIAARFSPILLSKCWVEKSELGAGLYTIESTMTRDPRGAKIDVTCVQKDEAGWVQTAGEFKSWMKWLLFAPKVMALFESAEPGQEYGVDTVSKQLDISRPDAQNTLYRLWKEQKLEREKKGRGYRYWLPATRAQLLETEQDYERKTFGGESQD